MKWVIILAIFSLLSALYVESESIFIESITVNQGTEGRASIVLDPVPNGLSGYDITVSLRNGEVGDIVGIEFPEWAKLSDKSMSGDSARLRAVDLEDGIKPGASKVLLAVIIIGNTRPGESLIELTVNSMDDDNGNPINANTNPGKIIVIGPTYTQTTSTTTTTTMTTVTGAPVTTQTAAITTNVETVTEKPTYQGKETSIVETVTLTEVIVQTPSNFYLILATMIVLFFAIIVVILTIISTKSRVRRRRPTIVKIDVD